MKINKKAQTDTIIEWSLYRIPFVIIIGVFFVIVLRSYYSTGLNTHETENLILIKRLLYSENLLAYRDDHTGRVYPGIIDLNKFDTEILESNIKNKNNRLAVNLELTNLVTGELYRAYLNEERARVWDDYVEIGGFDSSTLKRRVMIHEDGEFVPGVLKIKVLVKI